jgi:hypothetical protein
LHPRARDVVFPTAPIGPSSFSVHQPTDSRGAAWSYADTPPILESYARYASYLVPGSEKWKCGCLRDDDGSCLQVILYVSYTAHLCIYFVIFHPQLNQKIQWQRQQISALLFLSMIPMQTPSGECYCPSSWSWRGTKHNKGTTFCANMESSQRNLPARLL